MVTTLISGALGSLSAMVGHWFKQREEREKREHEFKVMKFQKELEDQRFEHALAEIDANIKVTEIQMEGELNIEEGKTFNKYVSESQKNILPSPIIEKLLSGGPVMRFFGGWIATTFGFVDVIRSLVRPVLTTVAFAALGTLAYMYSAEFKLLESSAKYEILLVIIDSIVYVVTASVQYWFYDRQGARAIRKKHR